jgi:hypothetical protein
MSPPKPAGSLARGRRRRNSGIKRRRHRGGRYGGHYGDCSDYHGWVVGIGLQNPRGVIAWSARGGGAGSGRRVGSPATDIDVPVEDGEPTALVLIASVEGLAARRE